MNDLIRLLPSIVRAAGETEEVTEAATMVAWRRVAGEGLRTHAVPFRLYRRTLTVAVADRTWQKQLEAMSGQLLFRLNSLLGQALVTYIEFRIDPQTVKRERAAAGGSAAETEPQSSMFAKAEREEQALDCVGRELNDAAAQIHDDALRHRFLLAAGSCIDRRQREG